MPLAQLILQLLQEQVRNEIEEDNKLKLEQEASIFMKEKPRLSSWIAERSECLKEAEHHIAKLEDKFAQLNSIIKVLRENNMDSLDTAANKIDEAAKRIRIIEKKLKDAQALPTLEAEGLPGPDDYADDKSE